MDTENKNNAGTIFIPDISGFSNFVNEIEIIHGQEITGELLEEIINSEELGFEISEIEGDAILYYKIGDKIKIDEIYRQSIKMLKNFRQKIEIIQKKRICKCNACSSVKNLKLKFVLHYDDLKIINIKNFSKLYGKGVIIAHRLLKNSLRDQEYVIFTKNYLDANTKPKLFNFTFNNLKENLESFGETECYYIKFDQPK